MFRTRKHPRLRWTRQPRSVESPTLDYADPKLDKSGPISPRTAFILDLAFWIAEPLLLLGVCIAVFWFIMR